jgi:nicotinamide-nucleotide amidase
MVAETSVARPSLMENGEMLPDSLTTVASEIAERLAERGETVAVAESSAGGLIAAALISVPGASAYFRGGVVFYTREGVRQVLGDATELEPGDRGACEPFARFLAAGTAGKHRSTWGLSETGASGPTGNRYGDPAGHTWTAVRRPDGVIETAHLLTGDDDRAANMERFAAHALRSLADAISAAERGEAG